MIFFKTVTDRSQGSLPNLAMVDTYHIWFYLELRAGPHISFSVGASESLLHPIESRE